MKLVNDRVYYGSLFFGSNSVEMQLMFDTGSEIIGVQTVNCANEFEKFCSKKQYDYNTSNRYAEVSLA